MAPGAPPPSTSGGGWRHSSIYGEEVGTPPIQLFPNLQIFRYAHRGNGKTWYARYYREDLKRYKPTRSLRTTDLDQAKLEASILFGEIRAKLVLGIDEDSIQKTIDDLLDEWITQQEKRYRSGEISVTLWRNKKRSADLYIRNYIRWKKWDGSKPERIPIAGWSDYRFWRVTEGWKLSESSHGQKPPKESTVNLEIGFIREWYGDKLIPEGFAQRKPTIKKIKISVDDLEANPPFTPEDYILINQAIRNWEQDPVVSERVRRWRLVVACFFRCCMGVGWRPESEGLKTKWEQVKIWEEAVPYDFGEEVGIQEESEYNAFVRIKDTKNKRLREADYPVGRELLYLRKKYQQWHQEDPKSYPRPMATDYLFHLPENGFQRDPVSKKITSQPVVAGIRKLSYTSVSDSWAKILRSVSLLRRSDIGKELPKYTIRSCRSWYVTNRLRNGTDIFLICKASGHDIATCKRHYERLSLREKRKELTRDLQTPLSVAGLRQKDVDQDALDFAPVMTEEIFRRNKKRSPGAGESTSDQIKLLEAMIRELRGEK
jgi:hypothetical protein